MSDALWVPRSVTETTSGADSHDGHFALWQTELLYERIAELEDHLWRDEQGWRELGAEDSTEWSKAAIDRLARRSRLFWLSNPLIRRAVNVRCYYTWGQGVTVSAEDERHDETLQMLLGDDGNAAELFSHQARLDADVSLHTDGQLFAALFTDPQTGQVRVRTVPVEQITDIVADPDDRRRVWFYRREWIAEEFDAQAGVRRSRQRAAWYPSVDYWPRSRPDEMGGDPVRWDAPMCHVREGALRDQRWAAPPVYPALEWARAHKRFLEDWYTIVRSLSRFAWKWTGPASRQGAAQTRLATTVSADERVDRNPPPPAGSALTVPDGQDLTPIPKTGATVAVEDGRQARLMVASALEIPDTFLSGDVDVGNHATARSLDRPTEMMVESRRSLWESFYRRVAGYALDQAVIAPGGGLSGTVRFDADQSRRWVEHPADVSLEVDWPPLAEHGMGEQIDALVDAATLGGNVDAGVIPREELARKVMSVLGFDDPAGLAARVVGDVDGRTAMETIARVSEQLAESLADEAA